MSKATAKRRIDKALSQHEASTDAVGMLGETKTYRRAEEDALAGTDASLSERFALLNAGDSRKKIPPARVLAELKRRSRALTDMADTFADKFMDKGMRRIQRLHDRGHVQEAIDFCTEWVEQLYWITFGDKQGRLPVDGSDEPSGILPNKYLPLALQIRAQGYAIADQYSAAVSDATEGLKICDYMLSDMMQSGQRVAFERVG